jgi:hypothetical protein
MSKGPRRNHAQAFEAKMALAVIKRENMLAKLACQFDVLPNHITQRKVHRSKAASSQASIHGRSLKANIAIGMAGKGAWPDNVFVERLWWSVKYEKVSQSLRDNDTGPRLDQPLQTLIYDTGTAYSSFDWNTADQSYFNRCCQSRGLNPACIPLSKPKNH